MLRTDKIVLHNLRTTITREKVSNEENPTEVFLCLNEVILFFNGCLPVPMSYKVPLYYAELCTAIVIFYCYCI